MKVVKYTFLLMTALIAFPICSFSQTRVAAHMCATIVSPAAISNNEIANLGDVAIANTRNYSSSAKNQKEAAGIEVINKSDVSLASFKISGTSAAYSITLPEEPVMTSNSKNALKISGFRTIGSYDANPVDDTENIIVGGTVHMKGDETFGTYTSANPLRITVNYN